MHHSNSNRPATADPERAGTGNRHESTNVDGAGVGVVDGERPDTQAAQESGVGCRVVVTRRHDDFHACITGEPGVWGCGKSQKSAIGDLVTAHAERFGIRIQWAEGVLR